MKLEELEQIFNKNEALFEDVKNIIDKKRRELKYDYISINDALNKSESSTNRIYAYRNSTKNEGLIEESKNIEDLEDIFSKNEIIKIEKIFKYGFVFIDNTEFLCVFAEQGFLDCHNEIVFTPNTDSLKKHDEDDEILKIINNNWYIYGVR